MFRKTHTIKRSAAGLAVAACISGLTASSALASGNTSFTREYATWLAGPKVQHLSDGRSPDTRDFAALAHAPVVTVVESPGFQWGDFGIGGAAAIGAMLLLGLSVRFLTNRQDRGGQTPVAAA